MPLLIPLLGLFGISAAVIGGEKLGENIANAAIPPALNNGQPGANNNIPWYIPVGLTVVGGVLLYKYGAKTLGLK